MDLTMAIIKGIQIYILIDIIPHKIPKDIFMELQLEMWVTKIMININFLRPIFNRLNYVKLLKAIHNSVKLVLITFNGHKASINLKYVHLLGVCMLMFGVVGSNLRKPNKLNMWPTYWLLVGENLTCHIVVPVVCQLIDSLEPDMTYCVSGGVSTWSHSNPFENDA